MPMRRSEAEWKGSLREGGGRMKLGSGAYEGAYSFPSRFESGQGTNPEELIAAAHAGCFTMALSAVLGKAGFTPDKLQTRAEATMEPGMDPGPTITAIKLTISASVPGISAAQFEEIAQQAKAGCVISRALSVPVSLEATLL